MNRAFRSSHLTLPLALLVITGLACSLTGPAAVPPSPSPLPPPTTAAPLPTEPPSATATSEPAAAPSPMSAASETPAAQTVVVHATGGNLNIRRGPGQAYDVVGFLLNGQNSTGSGRNEAAVWVYVPIPDKPGVSGWVSTDSRYVSLSPDGAAVQSLPVLSADPAKPAYLRNCTFHPMQIDPDGFVLKPQTDAPDNQKQVNPGTYTALDLNVAEATARTLSLKEGQTRDITTDGQDYSYACP